MHWMVCSVCYLGCMVVNINMLLLNEASLNVTTFRYCCLGFFLAWNPLFICRYRCCDGHFTGFGKYIFPQGQIWTALFLSADCTECSCSPNIVIFNNFLVFNFPFFISNNNFLFLEQTKYFLLIFDVALHYQLKAKCI